MHEVAKVQGGNASKMHRTRRVMRDTPSGNENMGIDSVGFNGTIRARINVPQPSNGRADAAKFIGFRAKARNTFANPPKRRVCLQTKTALSRLPR